VRRRLDVELVRRGLVPSRGRAVEAIDAGRVLVGGAPASTPARQVDGKEAIALLAAEGPAYVSRGGHKLAAALDAFSVDVHGRVAVDVGASTGGFTDCLLQRGAVHVHAIDVGRAQLAWSLRQDPRVSVMERTNVRSLEPGALDPRPDLCVADLSFISLRTVAPSLLALTTDDAEFVLLVKPQYEAGRARVGRRGVVRDPEVHAAVLREVVAGLGAAGLGVRGVVPSPLRGADGNVDFLVYARRGPATIALGDLDGAVAQTQASDGEDES
jgi:23S rRNA (cytidine1920-2'-O)/16S rRNA (cytidine1409-2'-O)-methyltransferase